MKKDRDWVDYVNLAANVASAAQLHSINQSLAEKANHEEKERQQNRYEAQLREIVFQTETMLEELEKKAAEHPLGTYVLALKFEKQIFNGEISTSDFRNYDDKDRFHKTSRLLEEILEKSGNRLTLEEKQKAEKCVSYLLEMPLLDDVITFMEEQDAIKEKAKELNVIEHEIKPIKISGFPSLWNATKQYFGGQDSLVQRKIALECEIELFRRKAEEMQNHQQILGSFSSKEKYIQMREERQQFIDGILVDA